MQESDEGIIQKYRPLVMTQKLKMIMKSENHAILCKLIKEIRKITVHLYERESLHNLIASTAFTLNSRLYLMWFDIM